MPAASVQMQSISGIITQVHVTSGESPPSLVGASVTLVDDRVFVFAGRLVTSRKMTNHMYVLDLNTLQWTRHIPPPDSAKPPKPRYFHSADVYNNCIIVFGGMGYSRVSTDGLCVLDDISIFDIETMSWKRPSVEPSLFAPRPRYAHLSAVANDKLVVIGGQDMNNGYLGEINVLDLRTWEWIHAKSFDKHVGAYRSIAITSPPGTRLPVMLKDTHLGDDMRESSHATTTAAGSGSPQVPSTPNTAQNTSDANPVYLYTNFNFADVKRELQLIFSPSGSSSSIEDCSSYMTGSGMPPGLRFPTGHTLGHHLILAGTYLSPQSQSFTMWALDLGTLTWSRIETGNIFSSGSWNRGVLHEKTNRFLVFGHRARNLLEDYNHRQVNFDHIAMVDMEAFGVYRLPKKTCSTLAQEMGLSLLNEPAVSDFRIIANENQVIPVNSAVLAQRWPYFAQLMEQNQETLQAPVKESSNQTLDVPDPSQDPNEIQPERPQTDTKAQSILKSHSMSFPYPYPVVIALLQFLYTDNLLTAQQYQPHILSQLLLLADMYDLPRLRELATHALHQMLNMSTAPLIFETAALSHQTSLQVRALKMMIAAKKMIQQQQQQPRQSQVPSSSEGARSPSLTSREGSYSVYSSDSMNSGNASGRMPAAHQQHHQAQRRPYADLTSPTSSYYRSPSVASYSTTEVYEPGSSMTSPKFAPYRNRLPSMPQTPPQAVPGGSGFNKSARPSMSEYTRYPGSSSPPLTPRPNPPTSIPDLDRMMMMSGSPGSAPMAAGGWSTGPQDPHSSSSSKSRPDTSTSTGRKKDAKKANGKEKKAFLESVGSKISMSFQ
ncbi:hypothetical protein BCR43DRAFT_495890 [Syncephalastrum racemosum]|uniref:BTB domain-containing protein n=1 Tax=Syncephalastrum racemosum TaxID=13706 RepID=A0A1X2H6U4_SYNRA|nr:hypothetical protein BCR43DRAFT_495890 [Syncephalastrum racemosum]